MSDIPVFSLIAQSGPVALLDIIILALMSVAVWAIIIMKTLWNSKEKSAISKWFSNLKNIESLSEINRLCHSMQDSSLSRISKACLKEIEGLASFVSYGSINARTQLVQESLERAVDKEKHVNDRLLSFLAISSSVAPFLGLFGTVWGIMHSFLEIGQQGSANITVVAPGIAEALITTIVGLSVAIPAATAYNFFVAVNRRSEAYMYNFASELMSLFKRGDLRALEASKGIGN
ncbi:MAG: MotA/TolQ/ExbB proton channel family protein [Fibrobacteria bacterium]|nr:MotA/TolQ/ExbB proton channel family protein [Fibrobacteria bacterium]